MKRTSHKLWTPRQVAVRIFLVFAISVSLFFGIGFLTRTCKPGPSIVPPDATRAEDPKSKGVRVEYPVIEDPFKKLREERTRVSSANWFFVGKAITVTTGGKSYPVKIPSLRFPNGIGDEWVAESAFLPIKLNRKQSIVVRVNGGRRPLVWQFEKGPQEDIDHLHFVVAGEIDIPQLTLGGSTHYAPVGYEALAEYQSGKTQEEWEIEYKKYCAAYPQYCRWGTEAWKGIGLKGDWETLGGATVVYKSKYEYARKTMEYADRKAIVFLWLKHPGVACEIEVTIQSGRTWRFILTDQQAATAEDCRDIQLPWWSDDRAEIRWSRRIKDAVGYEADSFKIEGEEISK